MKHFASIDNKLFVSLFVQNVIECEFHIKANSCEIRTHDPQIDR